MRVVVAEALVIVIVRINWMSLWKGRLIDCYGRGSRRRYLGRSIGDIMYPGTTLLHIFGCIRTTSLRSHVLGMPYSGDVLGCIVRCLCISWVL